MLQVETRLMDMDLRYVSSMARLTETNDCSRKNVSCVVFSMAWRTNVCFQLAIQVRFMAYADCNNIYRCIVVDSKMLGISLTPKLSFHLDLHEYNKFSSLD